MMYKEVKAVAATLASQAKLGEPLLILSAVVLSPTKFSDLLNVGDPTKKTDLAGRHVLFMEDGGERKKLFAALA